MIRPSIRKSLIVALNEARVPSRYEAVELLKDFTKRLALVGAQADGALEVVYMRGFQAGYEQAMKDKRASKLHKDRALEPSRAEGPRP